MRYACDALEELRKLVEKGNGKSIKRTAPGLIEELQSMYSRMEAGLGSNKDERRQHERIKELKQEIKELEEYKDSLSNLITLDEKIAELQKLKKKGQKFYKAAKVSADNKKDNDWW